VLNGDAAAAKLLAEEVYRDINLEEVLDEQVPDIPDPVDTENWKLWIDPIDATAEYIRGDVKENGSIPIAGLKCVTVLIGVYDKNSGRPIIGVVNQPFHTKDESAGTYKSKVYWGVCLANGVKQNNITQQQNTDHIVVLSASEDRKFKKVLKDLKYNLVYSAGAGHKILKVITGEADLYLLSKNTTYKWDTCAPQAILLSSNGVLINLRESIISCALKDVNYVDSIDEVIEHKNEGGLVAIRDAQQFLQLMQSFRKGN
jgi:inositol polyphosphate 1-phosphatase